VVPPLPPALRARDFRLLLLGQGVSLTGTQMQLVAVSWQLYLLTHSPLSLGLLGLFRVVPVIVLALSGGVVADAVDRRRLMLATQGALAAASLALLLATHLGHVSPTVIYACTFTAGAALAFDGPARQALLPHLVAREDLPNALGLYATVWQLAGIIGPALGGLAIGWWGVAPIYIVDVLSFAAVIAALLAMRARAPVEPSAKISLGAALDGLRFIRRSPLILSAMLLDFFATFFAGALLLMPIFADQLLRVGPRGLGLLYAAQPVGAALAGLVISLTPRMRMRGVTLLSAVAIYGLAIALFGVSRWFVPSLLCMAISGAADAVSMVIRQTIRQLETPDALRGRMTSVNMIFFMGGPQLGEAEAGFVARLFGARISVTLGGILCVVVVTAMALSSATLRRYELSR
jgi:MFS family permease